MLASEVRHARRAGALVGATEVEHARQCGWFIVWFSLVSSGCFSFVRSVLLLGFRRMALLRGRSFLVSLFWHICFGWVVSVDSLF